METNTLEEILKKDWRYKKLEKRDKILSKRLNAGMRNKEALYKRIFSVGKQAFDIQEIDDLCKVNVDIELSLLMDRMKSIMEEISFELEELDGSPSIAIDQYIAHREVETAEREAAVDKAEAAQARIKELLDALVSDQSVPSNEM